MDDAIELFEFEFNDLLLHVIFGVRGVPLDLTEYRLNIICRVDSRRG